MAHIISCMADADVDSLSLNSYIAKPVSPQPLDESLTFYCPPTPTFEKHHPFAWRMQQPEGRKYQLFPKGPSVASGGKSLDPEQAFALAMSQGQKSDNKERPNVGNGLRLRIKEHNLTRRRKVSVPELGPMTTVQEVPMDSPTIPGRPPLHERSISAPGNSWKPHSLAEVMQLSPPMDECVEKTVVPELQRSSSATPKPLSPKQLAPLVIPAQNLAAPRLSKQPSLTRLRSGSTPVDSQLRSARTDDSPKMRTPYTPMSAASTAVTASTLPTPISAAATESRSSPKPWEGPSITTPMSATTELFASPRTEGPRSANAVLYGHRRGVSESGSIMERGRPRKRPEVRNNGPLLASTDPRRTKSQERKAFEELPKGWKMHEAVTVMSPTDVAALQKQAFGQATRFEVLKKEDVESLSRELRQLDERTEYLRRTYTSLRAGRRNLHSRICQYLRSPRVAKFSHDSMLKQEEALAELDTSIDDWVAKLDQAENRRTRVRQKLLEHVAAAATLPTAAAAAASQQLQQAMGIPPPPPIGVGNISTPPRSPTKLAFSAPHTASNSPSPQRVVAQVPSTILEQPLVEEAAALTNDKPTIASLRRADVESIRIYAGDDVYALLADVENEITKMSAAAAAYEPAPISDFQRRDLHRARSHEMLSGMMKTTPTPPSPPAPSPPMKDTPPSSDNEGEVFLTNAVFRPTPPERANTTS